MKLFYSMIIAMLFVSVCFGQVDPTLPGASDAETFNLILTALGGSKSAQILGLILLGVQVVMLLIKSFLGEMVGKYKLLIVLGLTIPSVIIATRLGGSDWTTAIMSSGVMSAVQVFSSQLIKQFFTEKGKV